MPIELFLSCGGECGKVVGHIPISWRRVNRRWYCPDCAPEEGDDGQEVREAARRVTKALEEIEEER
jgi:hypothetical protein